MSTEMMVALVIAAVSIVGIWVLSRRVPHVVDDDWAPPEDEDVGLADPLDEEMRDAGVMGRIRANEMLAEQRQPAQVPWAPEPPAQNRTMAEVAEETSGPAEAEYVMDVADAQQEIVFLATPTAPPSPQPLPTPQPSAQWARPLVIPEPSVGPQPAPELAPAPALAPAQPVTPAPPVAPVPQPAAPALPPRVPPLAPVVSSRPAPGPQPARIADASPVSARVTTATPAPIPIQSFPAPSVSSQPPPAAPPPPAPVPAAASVAARVTPVAKPAGPVLRFAGVIRGDSSRHGDGRERRYVTLKKKEAVGFPWREGGRVPVDLEVNGKVYSAGVRSTRSQPVVYIAADLRGPTGEGVTLAAVLESAGMEKRQQVRIEVENGTYLRLLPGAVALPEGRRKPRR